MKIKKFYENIDPFNEEDWNENENLKEYLTYIIDSHFEKMYIDIIKKYDLLSGDISPEDDEQIENIKKNLYEILYRFVINNNSK